MFDDNDINLKTEYNKSTNELVELRQKYSELEQDWKYIKSLLDAEFEKNIQLQKENEELKKENLDLLEDLAYYKTKSASLEVDYLQYQKVNSGEVTTKKTIT